MALKLEKCPKCAAEKPIFHSRKFPHGIRVYKCNNCGYRRETK